MDEDKPRKDFPGGSVVKNPTDNTRDMDSIHWVGQIPWRREWQPTPVFLPGYSHRQRSLTGYSPGDRKKNQTGLSDYMTINPQRVVICPRSQVSVRNL